MEALSFTCSICGEASRDICVYCTKDTCHNHLCQRCHRCSDCCTCDLPLTDSTYEAETETTVQIPYPVIVQNGANEPVLPDSES